MAPGVPPAGPFTGLPGPRGQNPPAAGGASSPAAVTIEVAVPDSLVGIIVGRGGSALQQLEYWTGTAIRVRLPTAAVFLSNTRGGSGKLARRATRPRASKARLVRPRRFLGATSSSRALPTAWSAFGVPWMARSWRSLLSTRQAWVSSRDVGDGASCCSPSSRRSRLFHFLRCPQKVQAARAALQGAAGA